MQSHLPNLIDPWRLAADAARLEGRIPLMVMRRLGSSLCSTDGDVAFSLNAGVDNQGFHFLAGHAEAKVQMICQRCMEPMEVLLGVDFRLGLVSSDDESRCLPKVYDPLVITDARITLAELVEDELILTLPIVALHQDAEQCKAYGFSSAHGAQVSSAKSANPFAVLSTLLKKSDNQE